MFHRTSRFFSKIDKSGVWGLLGSVVGAGSAFIGWKIQQVTNRFIAAQREFNDAQAKLNETYTQFVNMQMKFDKIIMRNFLKKVGPLDSDGDQDEDLF